MPRSVKSIDSPIDSLYDLVTGDEDARVCKDIPAEACSDQPRNFFAYLGANLLGKIADELTSARLILPWFLGAVGAPAAFTGFLVPIRESGVLLPQMIVAAVVRRLPRRKGVWLVGAALSALATFGMALAAGSLDGTSAGWTVIGLLILFSLARGLCSVSAKDVLGKTVSKSRRGTLMGYSAGIAGVATLGVGLWLSADDLGDRGPALFGWLFAVAGGLWVLALGVFSQIRERPGATEGGGNALQVAVRSLRVLVTDRDFRGFVVVRILLLSVALVPPFFVLLAQDLAAADIKGLGMMIIASGLAASISAPIWGRLGDRSSRMVIAVAAGGAGVLGLLVGLGAYVEWDILREPLTHAVVFLLITVLHGGVRLGRKVYLVDLSTGENRAQYVAVSNTVIGIAMLAAGTVGAGGDLFGTVAVIATLSVVSLAAAVVALRLPEVSA